MYRFNGYNKPKYKPKPKPKPKIIQSTRYQPPDDVGRVAVANTEAAAEPLLANLTSLYTLIGDSPLIKTTKAVVAELRKLATEDHVAADVARHRKRAYSVLETLPTAFESEIVQDYMHFLNLAHARHDKRLVPLVRAKHLTCLAGCYNALVDAHDASTTPEELKHALWDIADELIELVNCENQAFYGEVNVVRRDFEASLERGERVRCAQAETAKPASESDTANAFTAAHARGVALASDHTINPFVPPPDTVPGMGNARTPQKIATPFRQFPHK